MPALNTLEEALDALDIYGADGDRWPATMRADFPMWMGNPEFAARQEEIKAFDDELAEWDTNDDEPSDNSVNVDAGEREGGDQFDESDPSEGDGGDGGGDAPVDVSDGEGDQPDDPDHVPDLEDLASQQSENEAQEPQSQEPVEASDDDPLAERQAQDHETTGDEALRYSGDEAEDDEDEDEAEQPPMEPMDIDLDEVRDLDESLSEILEQALDGAFDGSFQTCYTRDFDVIADYPSEGDYNVGRYEDRIRKKTGVMQKDLQRLIVARSQSYHVGGYRSGKLNGPALHRAAAGDPRIFRRKHIAPTMATAITLLVDCSGSMTEDRKINLAMESAWAFADILDRLKIPCEVIGFTNVDFPDYDTAREVRDEVAKMYDKTGLPHGTIRHYPTYMPIFKAFGDRFLVEHKKRMCRIMETHEGMVANNDAMALEYASSRLLVRTEARKIMIVFSDGQPADMGVSSHVIGNTMRRTIKRLEGQGVETIGIGIMDSSVKSYYPKAIVLNKVSELPTVVMKELKRLLAPRN